MAFGRLTGNPMRSRRPFDRRELQRRETRVKPLLADELIMGAGGDDLAVIKHEDAIGLEHRRQPVSDDQHRAPIEKAIKGLVSPLTETLAKFDKRVEEMGKDRAENSACNETKGTCHRKINYELVV